MEPVGRWFEVFCTRRRHKQSLSQHSLQSSSSEEEEDGLDEELENDEDYLKTLDPKDWKVFQNDIFIQLILVINTILTNGSVHKYNVCFRIKIITVSWDSPILDTKRLKKK